MNYNFHSSNHYESCASSMKLIGVGNVRATPDLCIIKLGVITENVNLEAAEAENTAKSNAVIDNLLQINIPKEDISTAAYNIETEYNYIEGKQVFRGYKVTNILSVRIKDLDRIGEVIDTSTKSGANYVGGIEFTIENPSNYQNEALNLAIKDCQQKARVASRSLNVKVCEIPYKISEESSTNVTPLYSNMFKISTAANTILAGEINISVRMEALFYY